jgi:hypothetical protein
VGPEWLKGEAQHAGEVVAVPAEEIVVGNAKQWVLQALKVGDEADAGVLWRPKALSMSVTYRALSTSDIGNQRNLPECVRS